MDELIKIAGFVCLVLLALVEAAVVVKLFGGVAPRIGRKLAKRESVDDRTKSEHERVGKIDA